MTTNEYLQAVLKSQSLTTDSAELIALRTNREAVEAALRAKFEQSDPKIRYGGSYAKNTIIRESYDLDMTCYFGSDDMDAGDSLKDVYDNVKKALEESYIVDPKMSALRLRDKSLERYKVDFHIDVVPGRFTDEESGDVFIHQHNADKERLKTNLQVHIDHIKGSGVTDAIKLIKLWKVRRFLNIKTFVLELMVIKVIGKLKSKPIEDQLVAFWKELVDKQGNIPVEDPANPTGNDLSSMNDLGSQMLLSTAAASTLLLVDGNNWELIYGVLQETNESVRSSVISSMVGKSSDRTKPWSR